MCAGGERRLFVGPSPDPREVSWGSAKVTPVAPVQESLDTPVSSETYGPTPGQTPVTEGRTSSPGSLRSGTGTEVDRDP